MGECEVKYVCDEVNSEQCSGGKYRSEQCRFELFGRKYGGDFRTYYYTQHVLF